MQQNPSTDPLKKLENIKNRIESNNIDSTGVKVPFTPSSSSDDNKLNLLKLKLSNDSATSRVSENRNRIERPEDETLSENADQAYNRYLNQSGWELTKNAAINTIGEIGLGALEGAGYLADIEQWSNLSQGKEQEFGNWFSDLMRKGKENLKEDIAPVFANPNEKETFRPFDGTWWAENAPSIGSALSLLIPATAAVKGLGYVGKGLGGANIIAKAGKGSQQLELAAKGISGALVSRYMENTMESKEVFDTLKTEALQQGKSEEEAKEIAGNAASKAWYANLANLAFDIPQYLMIFKSANLINKAAQSKNKILGKIKNGLKVPLLEGFEEVDQFVINEEAKRSGRIEGNLINNSEKLLVDRLIDYSKDGQLWTSFTMGALGGAVFEAAGKVLSSKSKAKEKFKKQVLDSYKEKINAKTPEEFNESVDNDIILSAIDKKQRGESVKDLIKESKKVSELEDNELVSNEIDIDGISQREQRVEFVANSVEKNYDNYQKEGLSEEILREKTILATKKDIEELNKKQKETETQVELDKIQLEKEDSDEVITLKNLIIEKEVIENSNLQNKEQRIEEINSKVEELDTLLKEVGKTSVSKITNELEKNKNEYSSLKELIEKKIVNETKISAYRKELDKFNSSEELEKKELEKEEEKEEQLEQSLDQISENINQNSRPQDIKQLRKQAQLINKEKEFNAEIISKVNNYQKTAPAFNPEYLIESLERRYANNSFLKDFEIGQLINKTKVLDISDIESFYINYETSENFKNIVDNYFKDIEEKNKENDFEELEEFNFEDENNNLATDSLKSNVSKAFISVGSEFVVENGRSVKTPEGQLIPSNNREFISDHAWLNDKNNLLTGSTIYYEVDFENFDYKKDNSDERVILLVHYIDGNKNNINENNRKVVGALPAYFANKNYNSSKDTFSLKRLRDKIEVIIQKGETDINTQTKVKDKLSGVFYNTLNDNKIHEILNEGDELVLAVGKKINGVNTLVVPNHPYNNNVVRFDKENITSGAIYQLLPNANGSIVPYRLYTHKLKENEVLLQNALLKLNEIIDNPSVLEDNVKDLKKDTVSIQLENRNGIIYGKTGNNWTIVNKENSRDFLKEKIIQIDSNSLNRGNYNRELSESRHVTTDVNPKRYIHSASISLEPYKEELSGIKNTNKESNKEIKVDVINKEETKKSEKSSVTTPKKVNPISGIKAPKLDLGNSKLREEIENQYKKWNKDKELKWFKERFPQVDIKVLDDLKNIHNQGAIKAWGVFKNAVVYIHENAAEGTTYHEAFHVAFNMFLNESEKELILNEASKLYNITRSYDKNNNNPKLRAVDFTLKSIDILQSERGKQVFEKGDKNKWDLNKILTELQVPKEQKQIILDKNINDREEIITSLLADNSFVVEVNITKDKKIRPMEDAYFNSGKIVYDASKNKVKEFDTLDEAIGYKEQLNKNLEISERNTQYYSTLTVPGGTNYTENEIATPDITPNIKGHAQFATDNGIGWFRSDEQAIKGTGVTLPQDNSDPADYNLPEDEQRNKTTLITFGAEASKTRRILEVQSDLFQKGRDRDDLISNNYNADLKNKIKKAKEQNLDEKYIKVLEQSLELQERFKNISDNQFLQLLNKDNNWVTFFVQSIIQDSVAKGYEKVLFPKGDTAAKIEGHQTLEEFKKQKESRIKELEKQEFDNKGKIGSKRKTSLGEYVYNEENYKQDKENIDIEINQLKQELADVESGKTQLSSIAKFYEETIANVLKKNGFNPVEITDEFGNKWNEVSLNNINVIKLRGESSYYNNLTNDVLLEEKLAEAYREFVEQETSSFPAAISQFFRRLKRFFNSLFIKNKPLDVEELFYRISNKDFKNKIPIYNKDSIFNTDLKFRLDNINPNEKQQRVRLINSLVLDLLDSVKQVDGNVSDLELLKNNERLGSNIQNRILNLYTQAYSTIYEAYETETDTYKKEKLESILTSFVEEVVDGEITKFGDYFYLALRDLSNFGININFNTQTIENIVDNEEKFETDEEQTRLEGWQINHIESNGKDTISQEVKRELRQLIKQEYNSETQNWEPLLDDIGFQQFVDFDEVYNYLERNLAEIPTSIEMVEVIRNLGKFNPDLIMLSEILEEDSNIRSKFFKAFSRTHAKFSTIQRKKIENVDSEGNVENRNFINIFNSNRRGITTLISDQWKINFTNPSLSILVNERKEINKEKSLKFKEWLSKYYQTIKKENDLTDKRVKQLFETLNKTGFTISETAIRNQFVETNQKIKRKIIKVPAINNYLDFISNFEKIAGAFAEGKNPFSSENNENGEIQGESKVLKELIESISRTESDLYQASFRNIEDKTVYSYILPNYISKLINRFKNTDLIKEYLKNDYYSYNVLLQELNTDSRVLNNFDYTIIDGIRDYDNSGTSYTNMNEKQLETIAINMFFNKNDKDFAWYQVPILADSPAAVFLKSKKYNNEEVIDNLYQLALQETLRISKARKSKDLNIKNYSTDYKYNFLPFLNNRKFDINNEFEVKDIIKEEIDNLFNEELKELTKIGVTNKNISIPTDSFPYNVSNIREFLKNYFYNNYFATSQITQITSGDLSFYGGIETFQKRNSQIWKPGNVMDINAEYEDIKVRETYNTIYLKDEEFVSKQKDSIKKVLDKSNLSKAKKLEILAQYDTVNQTDGQAFITLDRWKEILIGFSKWNSELEIAFKAMKQGKASPNQLSMAFEASLKPFYFGHSFLESGDIIPVQHKNSEFPLIPQLVNKSEDLKYLSKYLNDNRIDSIQFNSAVKVGEYGAVSFGELKEKTSIPVIHNMSNENYILQQEVPEHYIDSENLLGSQVRKIIIANLEEGNYEGLNKDEIAKLYQELISANIVDSYREIENEFSNIENIQKILLKEVKDRNLGEEFYEALEIKEKDKVKRFKLPLFHPIHSRRIESLINSIFKNRITKQKINGASFVLTSNFGFSEELNLVLNEETGAVEGMEVLLPWWTKQYFPKTSTGEVDITKIPEDLLEGIGYRIPTEFNYSIRKLIVKGFTPQEAGGIIILPEEITTIAGEDFDIDKLYVIFPGFEEYEENGEKKIRKASYGKLKGLKDVSNLSKIQRDTAIFDIMKVIMQHPTTAAKILEPGGFDILKERALIFRNNQNLNIGTRGTQRLLFKRNMTGAGLVGIFANHNSNHNIIQFGNLKTKFPIELNNKKLTDLNNTKNLDGEYISRTLATFLAASVDNAKEPVAEDLNINNYTSSMLGLLIRLGYSLDTVLGFINQPIIKNSVNSYINNGSIFDQDVEIIQNNIKEYLKAADITDTSYLGENYSPTENQLIADATNPPVNNGEITENIKEGITPNRVKEFYVRQAKIGELWLKYLPVAKELDSVINSMRGDTIGTQKTIASNQIFLNSIENAKELQTIDNVDEYFEKDVYPLLKSFTEYGINKPNEILKTMFPFGNIGIQNIIKNLEINKGRPLNEDEINYVNTELLHYYITGFDNIDQTERENIISQTSNNLLLYKKNKTAKNAFIDRLSVVKENERDYIEFYNFGSLTNTEKESITSSWKYMLQFGTVEEKKLAEDLYKYVLYTEGFSITPNSFGRFIPVNYLSELRNNEGITLSDYTYKLLEDSKLPNFETGFLLQFLRNNSNKFKFVPIVERKTLKRISKDKNSNNVVSFTVEESENKILVKDKKDNIYRYIGQDEYNNSIYQITTRLGVDNRIKEYDKNLSLLPTVIKENRIPKFLDSAYILPIKDEKKLYSLGEGLNNTDISKDKIVHGVSYNKHISKSESKLSEKATAINKTLFGMSFENLAVSLQVANEVNKQFEGTDYRAVPATIYWGEDIDNAHELRIINIKDKDSFFNPNKESDRFIDFETELATYINQFGITITSDLTSILTRGSFSPEAKNITLTVGSNRETLAHEVGHAVYAMLDKDIDLLRIKKLIPETKLYKEILSQYNEAYNNTEDFIEETVVTLIGKEITEQYLLKSEVPSLVTKLKILLKRIWKKAINFLKNITKKGRNDNKVDEFVQKISKDILTNNTSRLDVEGLDRKAEIFKNRESKNESLFQLISSKPLEDAIEIVNKKLLVFKNKGTKSFTDKENKILKELKKDLANSHVKLGIVKFANNVNKDLKDIIKKLDSIKDKNSKLTDREKIKILRQLKDYSNAYKDVIIENSSEFSNQSTISNRDKTIIKELNRLTGEIERLNIDYLKLSRKLIANVLKPFASDRGKNKNLDIEKSLELLDNDITYTQRWLDAIAESNDDILKIIDKLVKEYKEAARLESIKNNKRLIQAKKKLESEGIKTANFVYERDLKGNLTGNILSEYNIGEWESQRRLFFDNLRKEFNLEEGKDKPEKGTKEEQLWNRKIANWFSSNTQPRKGKEKIISNKKEYFIKNFGEKKGNEMFNSWYSENSGISYSGTEYFKRELSQPSEKYKNVTYKELSNSEKEFLNLVWEIKTHSDSLLPEKYKYKYQAPQIRKDIIERWKDKGIKGTLSELKENFVRVEDDTEFGLTDENGNLVNFLPVYFTGKLKDIKDLSLDIVSSLSAFNYMAEDFNKMNQIIDTIELTKDVLGEREVGTGKFDPVGVFKKKSPITISGKESKAFQRFEDYLNMVVYGRLKKDEGSILGVDKAKAADAFGSYISINSLALNLFAGIANPLLGNALIRQEAIAGEYFTNKNLLEADKIYFSELPKVMGDIGQREISSKLELWLEKMNTLQDHNQNIRGTDSERKTVFSKLFKVSSLFFINKVGEHQIQSRSSLALGNTVRLLGTDGKEYSLWDAYEVKNKRLELSQKYTIIADGKTYKEEDTGKEFNEKQLLRFIRKQNFINKRLNGIYNEVDRSAIQQRALGRLAMMFRKFMKPGWNRRFEKLTYNEEGEVWTEGYYNTTAKFMQQVVKDIKLKQFNIKSNWESLNDMEKANLIRSGVELAYMIGVSVLGAILTNLADDDEDNWSLNMMAYQAKRMYTEIAFYTNPNEAFRILKSPAAAVNQMQKIIDFIDLTDWNKKIERGRYKGMFRGQKELIEIAPLGGTLKKLVAPEEQLQFFTK